MRVHSTHTHLFASFTANQPFAQVDLLFVHIVREIQAQLFARDRERQSKSHSKRQLGQLAQMDGLRAVEECTNEL